MSENGEGKETREEQWPRRVILKNVDTLTECQAETGERRDEKPAVEFQHAVKNRTEGNSVEGIKA